MEKMKYIYGRGGEKGRIFLKNGYRSERVLAPVPGRKDHLDSVPNLLIGKEG